MALFGLCLEHLQPKMDDCCEQDNHRNIFKGHISWNTPHFSPHVGIREFTWYVDIRLLLQLFKILQEENFC